MDQLMQVILGTMAQSTLLLNNDHVSAMARARDTALHGLKVVEGVVAKELLVSDDPSEMSRLNAAVRIPSTIEHFPANGMNIPATSVATK